MVEHRARPGFRPDIEGLRAVAVAAVVLFHAGVPGLPGGFIGVDVFFVVSGFLITGLLLREVVNTGTVRLTRFYGARARRLLPAGITVLVAVAAASAWALPPLQARGVLGDALASALYVGNYRFALQGTDYLAADAPPSPYQHYWSLGVEEQFYLLWPVLLIASALIGGAAVASRRHRGYHRRVSPTMVVAPAVVTLVGVAVASFVVSLRWTHTAPPWAFFSLPSRAWELAIGGLVALSVPVWRRLPSLPAAVAGWAGLALVLAGCRLLGAATPYPGTAALLPVLGATLVIAAGCARSRAGVGIALSRWPLRQLGRYSYSWYLWHWPVLVLAPVVVGHALGLAAGFAAVAVSGVLAVLTTHAIEDPVRFAGPLRLSPVRSLLVGGGTTAVGVTASLLVLLAVPVPVGTGAAAQATQLRVGGAPTASGPGSERGATSGSDAAQSAVQSLTAQVQAVVAASADVQAVPSNLSPSLANAAADKAPPFQNGCLLTWTAVSQGTCAAGSPGSSTTVALVGDSHATQWFPAFDQIAQQRRWRLETLTKTTCPLLLDLPIRSPYLGREYTECEQWQSEILSRIRAERPALVILGMTRRYGQDFNFTTYGPQWLASLTRTVAELRAAGAFVLVLGPVPDPLSTVPTCLSAHLDSATACDPDRGKATNAAGIAAEQAATTSGGGHYAELSSLFCTALRCPVIVGNNLVFRDDNHLSSSYAQWLTPVLAAHIDAVLAATATDRTGSRPR